jgi:uncharacterized membrane protein
MFRNKLVLRLIGAALLLSLVIGAGFVAYYAGVAHGIAEAPEVAEAVSKAAENGQPVPALPSIYGYDWGFAYNHPYGYDGYARPHRWGANPFGMVCVPIFLVLLLSLGAALAFFTRRAWDRGHWQYIPFSASPGGPGEKKEEAPEEK